MKKNTYFWGLLLILCAGAMFGNMFGLLPQQLNVFNLILTGALIIMSLVAIPKLEFFGIIMPLAFALIINQKHFSLTGQGWNIFWASTILSLGLSMVFKRHKKNKWRSNVNFNSSNSSYSSSSKDDYFDVDYVEYDENGERREEKRSKDDSISISNNLGDKSHYVYSDGLRYATVENNLGSLNVYFDNTVFEDGCKIYVDNNLGQTSLYLPKEHEYRVDIQGFLGNQENRSNFKAESGIVVYVKGNLTLGNIEIVYI